MVARYAFAACLLLPAYAYAYDFNGLVNGAELLRLDDGIGNYSGPQPNQGSAYEVDELDAAFPPAGVRIGQEFVTRFGYGESGSIILNADTRRDTDQIWAQGHSLTGTFSPELFDERGGPRWNGYAAWYVFHSTPITRVGFDYDGINHWRLIPDAGDDSPGQLIFTWENIPATADGFPDDPRRNSFQMIWTNRGNGDADVELRYARCEWHRPLEAEYYVIAGFHNTVERGIFPDEELIVSQPDWYHPDSFEPEIKKLCLLSNINVRGVWHYEVRDGIISGCGIGAPYEWNAADEPGSPCEDDNNDPGDGCSPDCRVEANEDGDIFFEPPPAPWVDADGAVYDPLEVYDQCVSRNPAVDCNDADGDGIRGLDDNCPEHNNPAQHNFDGDATGDVCEHRGDNDSDNDGLADDIDLCPYGYSWNVTDPEPFDGRPYLYQPDSDFDAYDLNVPLRGGDRCDPDDDNDGILDCGDDGVCPHYDDGVGNFARFRDTHDLPGEGFPDLDMVDNDFDGLIDEANEGSLPPIARHDLYDNDGDGVIDETDELGRRAVIWRDRIDDNEDNCRTVPNPDQANLDGDVRGDACDDDVDGDFVLNCGNDGLCHYERDVRDNDRDGQVDEAGECADGCPAHLDSIDNDMDGRIDERIHPAGRGPEADHSNEFGWIVPEWPGPDDDGSEDNCPRHRNADQVDSDGDGLGDACDDDDGDGYFLVAEDPPLPLVADRQPLGLPADNCPAIANPDQIDTDGNGIGDACDDDDDGDGVPDAQDNCPLHHNDDQADPDGDLFGNPCDDDDDGDGVPDDDDDCPFVPDRTNADTDGDGLGDACDPDDDNDGIDDQSDNCPGVANPDQADHEEDDLGDVCDPDDDNDGVLDGNDTCHWVANPDQLDTDNDGDGDACDDDDDNDGRDDDEDNCPLVANEPDFVNTDGDDLGDACDDDDDDDGVPDAMDACPRTPGETADTDGDGDGDACGDTDDDNDGIEDVNDNCRITPNPDQVDLDGDGRGDACDADRDGDGINDGADNCPAVQNSDQRDRDGDRLGDACDPDVDGDNIPNTEDNCPTVPNPDQTDSDFNGRGDVCVDRDTDGVADVEDNCPVDINPNQADQDSDGIGDACDPDYAPTKAEVERCRADTSPLKWRACGGRVKKIGCAAAPGSPHGTPWLALLLAGALSRRRR